VEYLSKLGFYAFAATMLAWARMTKQQQLGEALGTARFVVSRDTFACQDLYKLVISGAAR
jgi:hypothetical protein